jgi:glycosyltransferase involved in cell wall biosynthesis
LFVSVIIPVFNDQAGVDSCLKALQLQDYPHNRFEVVMVDNASTTPIRIDPVYADIARVVVCASPGAYAARNVGIAVANGDVLAFTDADCLPDPNWISAGLAALHASHTPCVIGGEVEMRLSPRPTAVELYQYLTGFMQFENINNLGFTATANLFAFKSHLTDIGLFDEILLSGGDREWSWRAAKAGYRVKYAADAIVVTSPRNSLAAAIRQARRVAGGRYALRRGAGTMSH